METTMVYWGYIGVIEFWGFRILGFRSVGLSVLGHAFKV